jgi:hypothetical protein
MFIVSSVTIFHFAAGDKLIETEQKFFRKFGMYLRLSAYSLAFLGIKTWCGSSPLFLGESPVFQNYRIACILLELRKLLGCNGSRSSPT